MFARILSAVGLTLVLSQAPSAATEISLGVGPDTAVTACTNINDAPSEVVGAVEDGLGDYLVWIKDKSDGLWMCNASGEGAVFVNVLMEGDLLDGHGAELIGLQSDGGQRRNVRFDPSEPAKTVCSAIGNHIDQMEVIATVEDGLGDYLVWLRNAKEELWICNASDDAKLYSFAPVDLPLNDFQPIVLRNA